LAKPAVCFAWDWQDLGSAVGIGMAGQAAAGAWAKEAKAGKNLSFTYIILVGHADQPGVVCDDRHERHARRVQQR
jgi:hypothetical protein